LAPGAAETRMDEAVAIEVGGSVTRLPWECYLLRGALDVDAQRRLLDRVGGLAGVAFERWPEVAAAQDHPCIVTSHSANAQRPRECRRACGLERCRGHCGRHVGALYAAPEDVYAVAQAVARRVATEAPDAPADVLRFDPTHFWGLVYGDRDKKHKEDGGDEAKTPSRDGDGDGDGDGAVPGDERRPVGSSALSFGGASTSDADRRAAATGVRAGRMSSHLDRPVGWTLSLSIGRPVRFNLGRRPVKGDQYADYNEAAAAEGQDGDGVDVVVESGDALLFRGHAVFHAVDGFADVPGDGDDRDAGERVSGPPSDWSAALTSRAKASASNGWSPARLALLFRDEVDAAKRRRTDAATV
jgi:hypothetical protein